VKQLSIFLFFLVRFRAPCRSTIWRAIPPPQEETAMTHTKENPKVVHLADTSGFLYRIARAFLTRNKAYYAMVGGVPTKVIP